MVNSQSYVFQIETLGQNATYDCIIISWFSLKPFLDDFLTPRSVYIDI